MEDSAMKQTCKQNRLPIVTVVLGCCALILRRVLYAVAVDVKNLLPVNHPLEIVLWVLTAIAAASAVGLIVAGRCRRAGKCPLFLTHLAVCAFFVVHMLGNYGIWCSNPQLQDCWLDLSASALMALFAFYEAAFDVGLGRRRMQLATGLMAAYLGCAALSGSGYLILYFGCAVWALTDLCSLTPKPKQENAS